MGDARQTPFTISTITCKVVEYAPAARADKILLYPYMYSVVQTTVTAGISETKENPPGTGSATDTDFLAIFLDQKCGKIHTGEAQCGLFNTRAHLQIPGQKENRSHYLQDEPKQKI